MQPAIRAQSGTNQRTVPGDMVSSIVTKIEPFIKLVNNGGCILDAAIAMQRFYRNLAEVLIRFIGHSNFYLVGGMELNKHILYKYNIAN